MARKRSPRSQGGPPNPNKTLVVFLVLFILATLGLGGWLYTVFGERHKWEKSAKDADSKSAAAKKAEDWAYLQAAEQKIMHGDPSMQDDKSTEFERWKNLHDEFFSEEGGAFKIKEGNKFDGEKDKDAFFKLVEGARKYLGWNPQTHRYATTLRDRIEAVGKAADNARAGRYEALKKQYEWEQKLISLEKRSEQARAEQMAKIEEGNAAAFKGATKTTQLMTEQIEANKLLGAELEATKQKYVNDTALLRAQVDKLEKVLAKVGLAGQANNVKEGKEGAKSQPVAVAQAHALMLDISKGKPLWDRARGKIIRIDEKDRRVTIDKGSRDGIKPGLTFNVFGAGWQGRAEGPFKGTIEVVRVEPTTSLARITSLYDSQGNEISLNDPSPTRIIRGGSNAWKDGDLIFNLAWGTHVAVAGTVDWSGRGLEAAAAQQDELKQFLQAVESQGVVVDAYVDLRDGQVRGNMTPRTAYLIVGNKAWTGRGSDQARAKAVNDAIADLRKQAMDRGLFQISPDNFLNVVGYRHTRSRTNTELWSFRPGMPVGGTSLTGEATGEGMAGGPVTELTGRWSGKLSGGGQLRLSFRGDGGCTWQMVVGMDTVNGYTNVGRKGNEFTAVIDNRPVTLRLAGAGQVLQVTGQGIDAALTKD